MVMIDRVHNVQDTHTHGNHGANLLSPIYWHVPDDLPREQGENNVHGSRVDCQRTAVSVRVLHAMVRPWFHRYSPLEKVS